MMEKPLWMSDEEFLEQIKRKGSKLIIGEKVLNLTKDTDLREVKEFMKQAPKMKEGWEKK